MQRLADKRVADEGVVGIRGVDEGDAELHRAAQDADGFVVVAGRSPEARTGQPHRAVAQAVDREIAAESERAGGGGGSLTGVGRHGAPLGDQHFPFESVGVTEEDAVDRAEVVDGAIAGCLIDQPLPDRGECLE